MSDTIKKPSPTVESVVYEIKRNPSTRFSKADYQMLVYAVLSDKNFKAKRYLLRNDEVFEDNVCISDGLSKFLDRVLKHAGFSSSSERQSIIDTFEYSPKDVEWVSDAVDEAMTIYTECGKNMRIFRDKMLQLTIKKMERSGKHHGKMTYKKTVVDRVLKAQKRREKRD